MVFENDNQELGIEVRSVVSSTNRDGPSYITAHNRYEACTGNEQAFKLLASGHIYISIGKRSPQKLPATGRYEPNIIDGPPKTLFSALKNVGYGCIGPLKALSELKRELGEASGSVVMTATETNGQTLTLYPAILDAAFHSVVLAFSYPRNGQLWALHLPTRIQRIRVNLSLCGRHWLGAAQIPFVASLLDAHDAYCANEANRVPGFKGGDGIHSSMEEYSAVQVEELHVKPLTPATPKTDFSGVPRHSYFIANLLLLQKRFT